MVLEEPGQVAIGEDAGEPAAGIDEHRCPGPAAGHAHADQDLADRFLLRRNAALLQRTHVLLDLAQLQAQVAGRMKAGEIVAGEALHAADHQRQSVARRQHRCRAAAGGQPQRTGLVHRSQVDDGVCRTGQVLVRPVMAMIGTFARPTEAEGGRFPRSRRFARARANVVG